MAFGGSMANPRWRKKKKKKKRVSATPKGQKKKKLKKGLLGVVRTTPKGHGVI
jgi:hypothetical protein